MAEIRHFTDEEKAEYLNNPYTAKVTDCRVFFTLAFKQFVLKEIDKPGMTAEKVFAKAGYRKEIFTPNVRRYIIQMIRKEAASPEGLQEPPPAPKEKCVRKKHHETEFRELQERVSILEQQIEFLKKSRHLRETGKTASLPSTSSSNRH